MCPPPIVAEPSWESLKQSGTDRMVSGSPPPQNCDLAKPPFIIFVKKKIGGGGGSAQLDRGKLHGFSVCNSLANSQ